MNKRELPDGVQELLVWNKESALWAGIPRYQGIVIGFGECVLSFQFVLGCADSDNLNIIERYPLCWQI